MNFQGIKCYISHASNNFVSSLKKFRHLFEITIFMTNKATHTMRKTELKTIKDEIFSDGPDAN